MSNDHEAPLAPADDELEPLLNPEAVAKLLGVSEGQLAQLRFHGGGPKFIRIKRAIRYRRSALIAYMNGNEYSNVREKVGA